VLSVLPVSIVLRGVTRVERSCIDYKIDLSLTIGKEGVRVVECI
jgi:hypothetical protein